MNEPSEKAGGSRIGLRGWAVIAAYGLTVVAVVGALNLGSRVGHHLAADATPAENPLSFLAHPGKQGYQVDKDAQVFPPAAGVWRAHVSSHTVILRLVDDRRHFQTRLEGDGSVTLLSTGSYEVVHNTIRFADANDDPLQPGYAQILGSDSTHLALKNPLTGAIAVFTREAS